MSEKKTYWKGLSEKHQTPEFVQANTKEFQDDLTIDEFVGGEGVEQFKTGRRDFLKFMGFSVAAATLASCETPVIKSIPYVNKPEDITPGVANWYASSFYDGIDFANVLVKTREGRPIWLKGIKDGFSKAGLTPRINTSTLNLYNSSRLNGPTIDGQESSWNSVDSGIKEQLESIAAEGGNIRILSNTIISPSTKMVIDNFVAKYNGSSDELTELSIGSANVKHIEYDAISYNAIRKANAESFGKNVIPNYNFNKAKVIVSINADFISNWLLPTKFGVDYGATRNPDNSWMSKHFQFESVMSLTGANADFRAQLKPSEEGLVALAILNKLKGRTDESLNDNLNNAIDKAVHDLNENKGHSLVVGGSNNKATQLVINEINHHLGNYGNTIELNKSLNLFNGNDADVENLVNEVIEGKVDALLIYGSNPAYTLPNGIAFADAIKNIKLSVSFSEFSDETASKCTYICPDHNYLEAWNDYSPVSDHYSIQQPVIRPLYDTRQAQESLMVWSGQAERADKESASFHSFIKENWQTNEFPNQTEHALFTDFWNWSVHNGYSNVENSSQENDALSFNSIASDVVDDIKRLAANTGEWEFISYQNELGAGQYAANAWLQELPKSVTKVVWDNYITMAPSDCYKLFPGLSSEDQKSAWDGIHLAQEEPAFVATIAVNGNTIKLPIYPLPGQTLGTVGVSFGYGRGKNEENIGKSAYQCDEFGEHILEDGKKVPIGANVFKFSSFDAGELRYFGKVDSLTLNDEKYALACTQTHHTIMGRTSILKETSFGVFKGSPKREYNPPHELHTHAEGGHSKEKATNFSLWNEHPVEHVGHRWGMSIDLSSCNGCGVCIVSCHSENNVPVVGKDEVRRSRDMHWLRMDRYFSSIEDDNRKDWDENPATGDFSYDKLEIPEENPSVMFMPMLCQHCNHAPCETVCPVAATTHSNEGLNMMTYNRCIGTRYCGNNCPYKVRRFNWFNYRDYRKFKNITPAQDEMARLVLNPDVVVRSRGVMEKCSFCVQRIQEGKLNAKKDGRPVVDGDVVTACADACPNGCITFGDWNDNESEIRQKSEDNRAYQALEEVGVKPNIWYQLKVRNVDKEQIVANNDVHEEHEH